MIILTLINFSVAMQKYDILSGKASEFSIKMNSKKRSLLQKRVLNRHLHRITRNSWNWVWIRWRCLWMMLRIWKRKEWKHLPLKFSCSGACPPIILEVTVPTWALASTRIKSTLLPWYCLMIFASFFHHAFMTVSGWFEWGACADTPRACRPGAEMVAARILGSEWTTCTCCGLIVSLRPCM